MSISGESAYYSGSSKQDVSTPSLSHDKATKTFYNLATPHSKKLTYDLEEEAEILENFYLKYRGLLRKHEGLLAEVSYWKNLSAKPTSPCKCCLYKDETLSRANEKIKFLEKSVKLYSEAVRILNPVKYHQLRAQLEDSDSFCGDVEPKTPQESLRRMLEKEKENIATPERIKRERQFTTPKRNCSKTAYSPPRNTVFPNCNILAPETMPLYATPPKVTFRSVIPETLDPNEDSTHYWHPNVADNCDLDMDKTRLNSPQSIDATFYNPPSPILSARKGKLTSSQSSVKANLLFADDANVRNTENDLRGLSNTSPTKNPSESFVSRSPSLLGRFKIASSPSEHSESYSAPPTPQTPNKLSSTFPPLQRTPLKTLAVSQDFNIDNANMERWSTINDSNKEIQEEVSLDGSFLAPETPDDKISLAEKIRSPSKVFWGNRQCRKRLLETVAQPKSLKQAKLSRAYFKGQQVRPHKAERDIRDEEVLKDSALNANRRGAFPFGPKFEDSFNSLERLKLENKKKSENSESKVARKKTERKQLEGWDCLECAQYYQAMSELTDEERKARMNWCSRHRSTNPYMSNTPPGMWDPISIASPVPETPDV